MIHLHRRNRIYYLRLRLPKDLQKFFNKKEIKKSLRTCSLTAAKGICKILSGQMEQAFALMRSGMLTDSQTHQLAKRYLKESLDLSDEYRLQYGSQILRESATGSLAGCATPYGLLAEEINSALEGGSSPLLDRLVNSFIDRCNLTIKPGSVDFLKLRRELAKTHLEVLRIDERRDLGDFSDPYFIPADTLPPSSAETVRTQTLEFQQNPHFLSDAIKGYLADLKGEGKTRAGTRTEYKGLCERILWILGDVPINQITRDNIRKFREVLPKLPTHMNKIKKYKNKSLDQVLEMSAAKVIGTKQIDKYKMVLKAVFNWAMKEKWITDNPSEIISATSSKPSKNEVERDRDPYSKEDLQKIVDSLAIVKKQLIGRPERLWVPLIAAYTGARANEICQMEVEDVSKEGDVWHFIIRESHEEDDGTEEKTKKKTLKTSAAKRRVPIHPTLIELGFLSYVESRKSTGENRLWKHLIPTKRGSRRNFSNWWNGQRHGSGFNRTYITKNPKKVFHSFRHNAGDQLKQKMVDQRVADEILGHVHHNLALDRYSLPYELETKLGAIEKIDYGINFDPIRELCLKIR